MRTLFLLSLLIVALANADTLTMKNGRILNGTYLGGNAREIRLDMGDHVETIPVDRVATLQFDSPAPLAQPAPPQPAPPQPAPQQQSAEASNPIPNPTPSSPPYAAPYPAPYPAPNNDAPPAATAGLLIPQGTPITVRMIDSVDSQTAQLGDQFRASIAEPVVINGQTAIPRGADVNVRLMDDQQSGKISGRTVLTLGITGISIDGKFVDVSTGDVSEASASRGARSGKVIGGATALGAIIGAVAGGGKGAAIGAGSGAAIGTGTELATKGQRVKVPSETRLTFTLAHDVQL